MKVTIEIDSKSEMEKLSALFKAFDIRKISVIPTDNKTMPLTKGDKKIDPTALFGIWSKKPRTLESIRNQAWSK